MIGKSSGRACEGDAAARLPPWLACRKSTAFRLGKRRRRATSSPDVMQEGGQTCSLIGKAGRKSVVHLPRTRTVTDATSQRGVVLPRAHTASGSAGVRLLVRCVGERMC